MSSTNKVNMSLDDIIKQSRKSKGGFKGRGKVSGRGGRGRGAKKFQRNDRDYPRRNFGERRRYLRNTNDVSDSGEDKRTKLFVSNLQKEIVNSELRVC